MEQVTLTRTNSYTIDPNHATVHFWVRHMMVAKVHGELSDIKGTVVYDPTQPELTQIDVKINTNSLTTRNEMRDGHLKSPDFLDVETYPVISFKSREVKKTAESDFAIVGDLTIHGVTKEVTFQAEVTPELKGHFGGYVIGISASGVVNREDFGMTWNQAMESGGILVGKEVHFQIDLELDRPE